jgi:transcriptional pleiotropic regulator of transition state genes
MTALTTGIDRRIDGLGRIVIPAEIRDRLGLSEGARLDIIVRDGAIVLTPMESRCRACGHSFGAM